jgi:prepilin signal peptidase PulO-like enzyme (type II secretory pathway)
MNAAAAGAALGMTALFASIAQRCIRRYGGGLRARKTFGIALAACALVLGFCAFRNTGPTLAGAAILACAGVCAAIDLQSGYIFDGVLLAAIAWIVPAAILSGSALDGLFGALACGGALFLPFALSRGRAIGFGDVKLAGTAGLALGLGPSLAALWIACVSGGAVAAVALAAGRAGRRTPMRFGPFLALGVCVALSTPGHR